MIKYIYYRLCDKHHEKGKRKNVSSWYASRFAGTVYFMMCSCLILVDCFLVFIPSKS